MTASTGLTSRQVDILRAVRDGRVTRENTYNRVQATWHAVSVVTRPAPGRGSAFVTADMRTLELAGLVALLPRPPASVSHRRRWVLTHDGQAALSALSVEDKT